MGDPVEHFLSLWGEIADLSATSALLAWDQETQMPRKGGAGRANLQATLAGIRHGRLVATEMGDAVEQAARAAEADPGGILAAQVREARRILRRVKRIPERLAREKAEASTQGHEAWVAARQASDFSIFRPALERLLGLAREEAGLIAEPGVAPYDALLEEYEPGAKGDELEALLSDLARELVPLVAQAAAGRRADPKALEGAYPRELQVAFARDVAARFGFEFERGRLDPAPHPFCSGLGPDDVRMTWRCDERDFRPALFGILHETGHGLYEQGLPSKWQRTPIGDAASLGIHESQSRLWENCVGRSRGFWIWALPQLQESFPCARTLTVETLLPHLHTTQPSLIRVEADQGTYDLHVCVRFELERALLAGALEVRELPEAWDAAYERTLGLRPRDSAEGVLQDIHWSMGAFGYFPTYTLGNLMAAQLFAAASAELGGLEEAFERGEFAPLLAWLREKIHRHGSFHSATELIRLATGRPLSSDDYLAQRRAEVEEF